ncbi:MAG: BON domain-containing protein [Pyrinomonadaceae bacterium]
MKVKILTVFTLALALFLSGCGGGKSDADLQKAVSDKLTAEKVTGVIVAVKDGVATVSGEVADITVKNKVASTAKGVEGVKSVTDNTTLKALPQPAEPEQSDPSIKVKVEEGIKKLGVSGITVAVAEGEVTLTGTVPKDRLAEVIKATMEADVKKVNNKLTVK